MARSSSPTRLIHRSPPSRRSKLVGPWPLSGHHDRNGYQTALPGEQDRRRAEAGVEGHWRERIRLERAHVFPTTLTAYLAGDSIPVSWELMEDVKALSQFLTADLNRAVYNYEESMFINGTGTGQPLGYLNGATVSSTAALSINGDPRPGVFPEGCLLPRSEFILQPPGIQPPPQGAARCEPVPELHHKYWQGLLP